MKGPLYFFAFLVLLFINTEESFCQVNNDTTYQARLKVKDLDYIKRLDTFIHLKSWISANQMEYRLVYSKDFKMLLAPNQINSLSFGLSYRYLDLGFSFTPAFLNAANKDDLKGESERFS